MYSSQWFSSFQEHIIVVYITENNDVYTFSFTNLPIFATQNQNL